MKLKEQVTSLELSKRLKELGVKQESLFWWSNDFDENEWSVGQFTVKYSINKEVKE